MLPAQEATTRSATLPFLALPLLLVLACQPPSEEATPQPDRTAAQIEADMEAFRAAWVELANAGDVAGVAAMYTEDAVFTDPYGNVHSGRAAITEYLEGSFARATGYDVVITNYVTHGDMAASYGTHSVTVQGPDGAAAQMGMWQTVSSYQPDGSVKIRLHLSMIPEPVPET
jgi:uncharacterized protein (TIGR02246 family)